MTQKTLFDPNRIGILELANRLAVAPMTRVSAGAAGLVSQQMTDYYRRFARGGFGLIITEGLYTDQAYSQGYRGQPGLVNSRQAQGWRMLNKAIHAEDTRIIAQLMHAGALSQFNACNTVTAGPSALQPQGSQMGLYDGKGKYATPIAMTQAEIDQAIGGFAEAAKLAQASGFDGIEIHAANGYLLDQFLSASTNQRTDQYGGSPENRVRLICEVIAATRQATSNKFVIGVRISQKKVNDDSHVWPEREVAARTIFSAIGSAEADYVHTTEPDAALPAFPGSASLSSLAALYSGLPIIANGGVQTTEQAETLLSEPQATLVAIGKAALANPDWPQKVSNGAELDEFDFGMLVPRADLNTAERYMAAMNEGGQMLLTS